MPRGRPNAGAKLVALKKKGWREPVWYIRWSEGGRSRELTTGTGDRATAEQVFGRWLVERASAKPAATTGPRYPAEITIADVLALYGEKHVPTILGQHRIGNAIQQLLAWWGDRRVDAIRPETCKQYRRFRLDAGRKDNTIRVELTVLRAALHWTEKNGYLISAPYVELPPPPPGRDRWLTKSEAARLLWEARKEPSARLHLPLFILIALYTGARAGAIYGLRWSQVDLVNGRIDFNEPGRARTNKRRAVIPIPRKLLGHLLRAHRHATSPLVISWRGKPVHDVRRSFSEACKRAGLTGVVRHTLRHSAATWMAQAGVPMHEIAGWLGQTTATTTERYAHHHSDYMQAALRAMERR